MRTIFAITPTAIAAAPVAGTIVAVGIATIGGTAGSKQGPGITISM